MVMEWTNGKMRNGKEKESEEDVFVWCLSAYFFCSSGGGVCMLSGEIEGNGR